MNRLDERDTRLAEMDHGPLLKVVRAVIDKLGAGDIRYNPAERLLFVDADAIAQRCVERARRARLTDPVRLGTGSARVVTLNMGEAEREELRRQVRGIRDAVQRHLDSLAATYNLSLRELANHLPHPLLENQRAKGTLDGDTHLLHHDLATPIAVYRQRLTLERDDASRGNKKVFRWHKVLFSVAHSDFEEQMRTALERHVAEWTDDEDERDELRVALERQIASPISRLNTLKRAVDTQTIGQIKKEAQVRYLEFLATAFESGHPCRVLLHDLARRLRLIQRYVHDLERPDSAYDLSYLNQPYDYRAILATADAFEPLPVIPRAEGHLGEVTGEVRRERLYTFGMRLKLNGTVQVAGAPSSYAYHVAHLATEHHARAERKLLLLLLYTVVFDRFGDLTYDPLAAFEQRDLPALQGADEEAKRRLFAEAYTRLHADTTIAQQVSALVEGLREKLRRGHLPATASYPVHISVLRGVLDPTAREKGADPFFRERLFERPYRLLAYIAVSDAAVSTSALYKLTAEIRFDTMTAYEVPDARHDFSMAYLQEGQGGAVALQQMPIVLGPAGQGLREEYLTGSSGVIFSTRPARGSAASAPADDFVYRYSYSLLVWMIVHIVAALVGGEIFVPVLRFHQTPEVESSDDDRFVASLGKVLAHLLGQQRLSSSQGFSLVAPNRGYRLKNARSSLYAPLPKVFARALADGAGDASPERCAIVVVSSRACDDVAEDQESRVLTH